MRHVHLAVRALFFSAVGLLFAACPATTPVPKPVVVTNGTVEFIPLKDVITVIKRALQASQNKISDDNLPPLESVTLTLQTSKVKSGEFTLNLFVIGGSQNSESSDTQQLVIKLTPPKPNAETAVSASLYQQLVDAITAASTAASEARTAASGNPVPLSLSSISTELAVSIKRVEGGNIGIDLTPLKLGGKVGETTQGLHKITLSFATPQK